MKKTFISLLVIFLLISSAIFADDRNVKITATVAAGEGVEKPSDADNYNGLYVSFAYSTSEPNTWSDEGSLTPGSTPEEVADLTGNAEGIDNIYILIGANGNPDVSSGVAITASYTLSVSGWTRYTTADRTTVYSGTTKVPPKDPTLSLVEKQQAEGSSITGDVVDGNGFKITANAGKVDSIMLLGVATVTWEKEPNVDAGHYGATITITGEGA